MLQINLIPLERRRKERTPLPRFIVIIAAVIVVLGLLIWDVKTLLDTNKAEALLAEKNKEWSELQKTLTDAPLRQKRVELLREWKTAADKITDSRPFKWWHAVDILWDIFNEFPTVWITNFQTSDKGPTGKTQLPIEAMMKFNCLSFGETTKTMTDFRRRLKNTPDLKRIFTGGINKELSFEVVPKKDEWVVKFLIELYRVKSAGPAEKK